MIVPTFLVYGKNNAGARDDYVYSYFIRPRSTNLTQASFGLEVHQPGALFLARVHKDRMFASRESYAWFTGLRGGQPTWGTLSAKKPVFENTAGTGWCASASFNSGLGRYFLATEHTRSHSSVLGLWDAPEPWGPWTTVRVWTPSDRFGQSRPGSTWDWKGNIFFCSFAPKWLSQDGRSFTLIFTGGGNGKDNYGYEQCCPPAGAPLRFEEVPGIDAFSQLHQLLPPDLASWERNDGIESSAPFSVYCQTQPNRYWPEVSGATNGCVRNIGSRKGNEFVCLPMGILPGGVILEARSDLQFEVLNPLTGTVVSKVTLLAGKTMTLSPAQGLSAYILKGQITPSPSSVAPRMRHKRTPTTDVTAGAAHTGFSPFSIQFENQTAWLTKPSGEKFFFSVSVASTRAYLPKSSRRLILVMPLGGL